MDITRDISCLKNIGDKRKRAFNDANIFTIKDIIEYFPRDYEDRSVITPIEDCHPGYTYTVKARISGRFETSLIKKLKITKVKAYDGSGEIELVWFNQPYMKTVIKPDTEYAFTGKVNERLGRMQMESPDYEEVKGDGPVNFGRIIPKYVSAAGLSQKQLRGFVKEALECLEDAAEDFLPDGLRRQNDLCGRKYSINNIHFPESGDAFFKARRRLVFEELLLCRLRLYSIKGEIKKEKGIVIKNEGMERLLRLLPFTMTSAQKRVLEEIGNDLQSGSPMNRLVQGDVGSGKTAVAVAAAFLAVNQGYQAAIMAPTEVLANQHYEYFSKIFGALGIKTVLLSGSMKKKDKQEAYKEIENGTVQMAVGTHALIEQGLIFKNLAVTITDEQHRFGVRQRMKLPEKGISPHMLVMSATPIPRTLALITYGDLDVSVIDELPPGRQKIETYGVNSAYRERIYDFLEKEIEIGRQVYIICPMIEESDNLELKSVLKHAGDIAARFKGYKTAYLHGKMKNVEKQEIMQKFISGGTDILVSTTVIEVGVNVPNASVMLIENAERFGLSQLHQLRGRVGRGDNKSYCIMMSDSKSKITKERIKAMAETSDGFKISEMDLKLRGPGDYFGTRQHGLPEFKIANLYKDMEILRQAHKAAENIIKPRLLETDSEYAGLKREIEKGISLKQNISL